MKLLSIETTNFKKLRRFKADFTDGLNVIVGDNAQGKSTLLQAIECALYGASVVPGKKDKIPTWGQSSWKILLEFAIGENVYELTRTKSTARLVHVEGGSHGDKLIANGNTPVTEAIEELLDLNAKDYSLFMQSKQGETSGVLTFGATALNKKVEAFAGISLIDRVQSLAQEEYRTHKASSEALAVEPEELKAAEDQVEHLRLEHRKLGFDVEAAIQQLEGSPRPADLEAPSADPDAMQCARDQFARLERDLATARIEAKAARERYDDALQRFEELEVPADASELEDELAGVQKEVRSAVAKVEELQRGLTSQEQMWEQLVEAEKVMDDCRDEDEIGEALSSVVQQLDDHDQDEQKLAEAMEEQRELLSQVRLQSQQLQELKDGALCPTCGTQLSEHDPDKLEAEAADLEKREGQLQARFRETKAQAEALKKQRESLVSRQRALDTEFERAQAAERKVDELRDKLVDLGVDLTTAESPLEAKLAEAKEVHEGLLSRKASLAHRVEQAEADQVRYDRAKRAVNAAERDLKDNQEKLERVKSRHDEVAQDLPSEADIEQARREHREYEAEKSRRAQAVAEAQHAVEMAKAAEQQAQKDLDAARHELGKLQDRQARSLQDAKVADAASRLSRFLRERRAGYLQEVWDAVLAAATKQVAMASKGMITRLAFDDGDFLFEEEGVLAPVASASGAQKAHIGVALRIGLSRALYGSSALIIFDEPTESMSEHHASGLSASLAGAASQCLLITHREQDQDLATNVVEVAT